MHKLSYHKSRELKQKEEIFNSFSHGFGVLIALGALVILVVFAALHGTVWHIISYSIFGITMVSLYLASTIYHGTNNIRKKIKLNLFDHSMIYLLIAGSYTPICLVVLHGVLGWILFGIVWTIAIAGVIYKLFFYSGKPKERKISAWLYVAMGWIAVTVIVPLIINAPAITLWFLLAGGLSYSLGVIFYLWEKLPFAHGIFHLFILGGSICHFFSFLFLLPI